MNLGNFEKPKIEPINVLKNEHLKEGISPVMMSIYNRDEMTNEDILFINNLKKGSTTIRYGMDLNEARNEGFYSSGRGTYLISEIDSANKYSEKYFDCTAVYAIGIDKKTGENISFLSHQNPEKFLKNKDIQVSFKNDLSKNLDDLKNRCIPNSIDVVIMGGNKNTEYAKQMESVDLNKMTIQQAYDFMEQQGSGPFEKYKRSIDFLSKIISNKLNFYPMVISGPNSNMKDDDITHNNSTDLYFDNKNRRIYQVRANNESTNNESYLSSDIDKKISEYR